MKHKLTSEVIVTLLLIGMSSSSFSIQTTRAEVTTWIVDDDGPADFPSIQEAIDSPLVVSGDTIFVCSGTYYENVIVDKTVSLVGENKHTTIIDGLEKGFVIEVKVNNVKVTGFAIQGSGYGDWESGVRIDSSVGVNISHNTLRNNQAGILLLYSDSNFVASNTAVLNTLDGIVLIESNNNIIVNNNVSNSLYGIALSFLCDGNTVNGNTVSDGGYGISLWYDSDSNIAMENNVSSNDYGIYLFESNFNLIVNNNFIDNTLQAYAGVSINTWDNGYGLCGNFWSDYTDQDSFIGPSQDVPGIDGVWDHPYVISNDNQDRYPLVTPWTPSWIPPWIPPEALADLIQRKAWPEHRHFDISKDEDGDQALFALARNLSPPGLELEVYVRFEVVRSDGFVIGLTTETRAIAPRETAILTSRIGLSGVLDTGKYYATAKCYYSFTGSCWAMGTGEKTLSFSVVP